MIARSAELQARSADQTLPPGDPYKTTAVLCRYLVELGYDGAEVAEAFADQARTWRLPRDPQIVEHRARTAREVRSCLVDVIGLWAADAGADELQGTTTKAGGALLHLTYLIQEQRVRRTEVAWSWADTAGADDRVPPRELVLLPYGSALFVLPTSRVVAHLSYGRALRNAGTWGQLRRRLAELPLWTAAAWPQTAIGLRRDDAPITENERGQLTAKHPSPRAASAKWGSSLLAPFWSVHPCFPIKEPRSAMFRRDLPADRELWLRRELEHLGYSFVRDADGLGKAFPELAEYLPAEPLPPDTFWRDLHERAAGEAADAEAVKAAKRFELGCPFCGDPHPAENEDEGPDLHSLPVCEHYVGRYDPDGQPGSDEAPPFDGGLAFLEDLEFSPYDGADEPTEEAFTAAFGDYVDVAIAPYPDGFREPGYGTNLLSELTKRLHLVEYVITGSMVWSCFDYYALDAGKALTEISTAAQTVVEGMACLNRESTP